MGKEARGQGKIFPAILPSYHLASSLGKASYFNTPDFPRKLKIKMEVIECFVINVNKQLKEAGVLFVVYVEKTHKLRHCRI
jgi:hypothetical protein